MKEIHNEISHIITRWDLQKKKPSWRCICVGHSMGGALAAISALDLAIHTKQLREKKAKDETIPSVYAVGIASAIPGGRWDPFFVG